uniref:Uncharacterized protein n=1 Tax=Oryza barthii TaxID=65489 RepID=A0A0D3FPU8_9ORYZ
MLDRAVKDWEKNTRARSVIVPELGNGPVHTWIAVARVKPPRARFGCAGPLPTHAHITLHALHVGTVYQAQERVKIQYTMADAFTGARDDTSAHTSAERDEEAEKAEKPPRSHAASAGNRRGSTLPPRPVQLCREVGEREMRKGEKRGKRPGDVDT